MESCLQRQEYLVFNRRDIFRRNKALLTVPVDRIPVDRRPLQSHPRKTKLA